MNIGKSFKQPVKDLTDSQRIEALEQDRPVLIEKLALCDRIQAQANNLESTVRELKKRFDDTEDFRKSLTIDLQLIKSQIDDVLQRTNELRLQNKDAHERAVYLVKAANDSAMESTNNLRKEFLGKLDNIAESFSNSVRSSTFQEFIKAITSTVEAIQELSSTRHSEVMRQVKDLREHFNRTADVMCSKSYLAEQLENTVQRVNKSIAANDNDRDKLDQSLSSRIESLRLEVAQLKASLKEPQELVDKAIAEVDKKLQLITLDASNACLRSQHTDQKFPILERRLENIDLRLKKVETA